MIQLLAGYFPSPLDRDWARLFVQSIRDENARFYRAYWDQQLQQYEELTSEYRFTMRLHADGMDFLKKIVPAPQYQIEPAGDGAWATVQVQLDSMDLARMLALGLGAQAVVVEPQELREAVLATAGAILRGANEAGS